MQKTKEKCCADCKHCIRHDIHEYECKKTGVRDRITGKYEYKECRDVIDTSECEFVDITRKRFIVNIVALIVAIGTAFFVGWNML